MLRHLPAVAGWVERHVPGELRLVLDDRAAIRLELCPERDLPSLREADDADALAVDLRVRSQELERRERIGHVGSGRELGLIGRRLADAPRREAVDDERGHADVVEMI